MAAIPKWSRYEFAEQHQDEDGNKFLDVPEPITRTTFRDDARAQVGDGTTLHGIAWSAYRAMLNTDRGQDIRPSGFWWVIAELNDQVDPLQPLPFGDLFRVPGIESLVSEILVRPGT